MRRLAEAKRPTSEVVAEVVGLAVGSSVNYAQSLAQVVDFYLDAARAKVVELGPTVMYTAQLNR